MTAFIHTRVRVGPGLDLVIDGNSKITASNGTYANPAPNAFSLPSAAVDGLESGACPGSTAACRLSCYTHGLAKHAPDTYAAYAENARALTWILARHERAEASARRLGAWISEHCAGGFRWHVSGDVWHRDHAYWIADVCKASPDVGHWIYTRTLDAVGVLRLAHNLAVNVSADLENYADAKRTADTFGARIAYMATAPDDWPADLPRESIVFPDYPLRGRALLEPTEHPWWKSLTHAKRLQVCPADQFGQSEAHRCGPCNRCMVPRG